LKKENIRNDKKTDLPTPAIVHCGGISYSEIPAYLLTLVYGGKSSRIYPQRNHSQTRYLQAEKKLVPIEIRWVKKQIV